MTKLIMNIQNYFTKTKSLLLEILLLMSFVCCLMSGTISNYTTSSFLIKSAAFLVIIFLIALKERSLKERLLNRTSDFDFAKAIKIISLLIVLPALTLFYSANPQFGFLKILNLILSALFPALILFYLQIDWNADRLKLLVMLVLLTALISAAVILIEKPFYYDQVYDLMTFHWSHVFFGRFLGLAFLASLIFTINQNQIRAKVLLLIVTLFIAFGLIITGLRSAISGVVVSSLFLIAAGLIKRKISSQTIMLVTSVLFAGVILFFIAGAWQGNIRTRIDNLVETFQLKDSEDEAIESRIEGYKVGVQMISDSPLIGRGFGGFKSFYKGNKIGYIINYPHNIFIEAFAEMGAAGLLLIIFLIIVILKKSFDISYQLFAVIIFSLWLAQFSKDIPSQTTLWVGLAFVFKKKQ